MVAHLRLGFAALAIGTAAFAVSALMPSAQLEAQRAAGLGDPAQARAELNQAQEQARKATERAQQLTAEAQAADEAADKSAREAAALAAQIQLTEAEIAEGEARLALITDQQNVLDARLAQRQQPIVRLTAALQNMARRPLALSALRPGSLKDTVYVRAVLETTAPEIRNRTRALRAEVEQGRRLEAEARLALEALQADERRLGERRAELSALATRQRAASRTASGVAMRENDRALALAEQARDLDELVGDLDQSARLRRELAALPGPIIRPARPGASEVLPRASPSPTPSSTAAPAELRLPVDGRIALGFGAAGDTGQASKGLVLVPRSGAQVVSPAAGRVAFAGPYRGYGQIVIIEHANGWASLVTGLAKSSVTVGDIVVGGSPLGSAADDNPSITLELRNAGEAVNPLEYMG